GRLLRADVRALPGHRRPRDNGPKVGKLTRPRPLLLATVLTAALLAACGGASHPSLATPALPTAAVPQAAETNADPGLVGKPQNRSGIGDVDLAIGRYEDKYQNLVRLYESQPWYKDGLTRDEALFVERGLSFVGRYDGPRFAEVPQTSIEKKLYKY